MRSPYWKRRRHRRFLTLLSVLAVAVGLSAPEPGIRAQPAQSGTTAAATGAAQPQVIAKRYRAMGTAVGFTAYVTSPMTPSTAEVAFAAAYDEVVRIERLMTDWEREGEPPSDLLRVNAAAGERAVVVAPETLEVITAGLEMSRRSQGAFDITYAAMRGVWKFDEDIDRTLPPAAEIARRRRLINWRDVVVDAKARTVKLRRKGMRIGLGGIAKGYAVDRAAAVLRAGGLRDFMVQAGGDLYVSGQKGTASWMVGVRDPRGVPQDVIAKMPIRDHAFSTAGDYERFFIHGGKRYHHIIDPKTGYPARASRSVTVFAPSALVADALDDAIFILGPKRGLALCAQYPDAAALIVDAQNKVWMSPSLEEKLVTLAAPKDGV